MKAEILRVDGSREEHTIREVGSRARLGALRHLTGCECFDMVNLRDGRVMCVDDTGLIDGKPINVQATSLYHSIYPRAKAANQPIAGDVAIVLDEDFA